MDNPWLKEISREMYGCDVQNCPQDLRLGQNKTTLKPTNYVEHLLDMLDVLSLGIQKTLKNCTDSNPRNCISGERLYKDLTSVKFSKRGKDFEFNKNNDGWNTCIQLDQLQGENADAVKTVFKYYSTNQTLVKVADLVWSEQLSSDKKRPPESFCSLPCSKQSAQQIINRCCFQCTKCDSNEIIRNNRCEICPETQRPSHQSNFTKCIEMRQVHLDFNYAVAGPLLFALSFISLAVYFYICYYLWKHRFSRAMSLENFTSGIMLTSVGGNSFFILFFLGFL